MKCGYCNGTGEHINDANRMTTCEFCGGTGEVKDNLCETCGTICPFDDEHLECDNYTPLTNEGWLRTATTEQLAEWIAKCIKDTIILTHGNRKYTDNIVSTKWWTEWLKQPHTDRE